MINKISTNGLNFIKSWEKLALKSYICSKGFLTIGYGHRFKSNEVVIKEIDEHTANEILLKDINYFVKIIADDVKIQLNQNQFDALVSLVFNWGEREFKKSKGLICLNKNKIEDAKIEFFSKEKGVVKINGVFSNGLYNRRTAELKLFNLK